jgi:hypothetical protein
MKKHRCGLKGILLSSGAVVLKIVSVKQVTGITLSHLFAKRSSCYVQPSMVNLMNRKQREMENNSIEQKARQYADKVCPFVWPKNKEGEDIVQRVGQAAPGSAKHRKLQSKLKAAYIAGASESVKQPAPTDPQEVWDDHSELVGTDISDLDMFAGREVMTKGHFNKLISEYNLVKR